jgi:hypothetical protein
MNHLVAVDRLLSGLTQGPSQQGRSRRAPQEPCDTDGHFVSSSRIGSDEMNRVAQLSPVQPNGPDWIAEPPDLPQRKLAAGAASSRVFARIAYAVAVIVAAGLLIIGNGHFRKRL